MVAGIFGLPDATKKLADLENQLRAGEARRAEIAKEMASLKAATVTEQEIAAALGSFRTVFDSLPPVYRARSMALLLEQVTYDREKCTVAITFHPTGIKAVAEDKL